MEERAQVNAGKISWGEFLMAIEGPWHKAFTPENVQKSFKVTGTWPVDRSKITSNKIAPAVGLSITGGPIIELTSPVKTLISRLGAIGQLGVQPTPELKVPAPSPGDPDHPTSPGLPVLVEDERDTFDEDLNTEFRQTRVAFLFDGSGSSTKTAVPPLILPPLPPFKPLIPSPHCSNPNTADRQT